MANPETHSVAVTLPADIIEEIEYLLDRTECFSNKPDFVMYALRDLLRCQMNLKIEVSDEMHSMDIELEEKLHEPFNIMRIKERDAYLFKKYEKKKDTTTIMMKMPVGLWLFIKYASFICSFSSVKEFIRYAVMYYIHELMPDWRYSYSEAYSDMSTAEIDDFIADIDRNIVDGILEHNRKKMPPKIKHAAKNLNKEYKGGGTIIRR